jgi:hypothetical protein
VKSFTESFLEDVDSDDSEEREEELSSIPEVMSPLTSDEENANDNNLSMLNSARAEQNEQILAPGSGTSTPRQAQSSLNRSLRSIRSVGDFLVRQGGRMMRNLRRR